MVTSRFSSLMNILLGNSRAMLVNSPVSPEISRSPNALIIKSFFYSKTYFLGATHFKLSDDLHDVHLVVLLHISPNLRFLLLFYPNYNHERDQKSVNSACINQALRKKTYL